MGEDRNYKLYLKDIEESIKQIEEYTKNISEEEFEQNLQIQDAVIRRLEIIGEATKKIPRSVKNINKAVPWEKLSGYRDFIIHSYFEASINRIWIIVKEDLPKIREDLKKIKLL